MTPKAAKKGRSFKGAIAYIVHDPDNAHTDERVLFTETRNLRTDDPEKAAKVMAYTAQHAAELKEASGVKATGRKTEAPVYHLTLSWVPGEKPDQGEMMQAGTAVLEKLGYGEHEAVFAAHGDKAHLHLHIVVNRIHPETGKTHNPKDDQKILQSWGHEYDKARGMEHHTPQRAAKHEKDPERRADYQARIEAGREGRRGANDNGMHRAEWEAAAGAAYPKSGAYQDIRVEYAERVKALSGEGRELHLHHRQEWAGLKAAQKAELKDQAHEFRQAHKAEIKGFMQSLREERTEFLEEEKYRTRRMDRDVHISVHTPVGSQGPEHRGNLGRLFNDQTSRLTRAARFEKQQDAKKKEFFENLESREDAPQRAQAEQKEELRSSFSHAAAVQSNHKPSYRRHRADLLNQQRQERNELWERQQAERATLQDKWSELNGDRAKAWDAYRERRTEQEAGKTDDHGYRVTRTADSGRAEPNRGDPGRDSGRGEGGPGLGRHFGRN